MTEGKVTVVHSVGLEATRLLTVYLEHRDSDDSDLRRRAHVALDRFLMEHRELAASCIVASYEESVKKKSWLRRAFSRRAAEAGDNRNAVPPADVSHHA